MTLLFCINVLNVTKNKQRICKVFLFLYKFVACFASFIYNYQEVIIKERSNAAIDFRPSLIC